MTNRFKRFRIFVLSISAVLIQFTKLGIDRLIRGKPLLVPNYTLLEPGLYIGGHSPLAPPSTHAVLNVSPTKDEFTAPISEWMPLHSGSLPSLDWVRQRVLFIDTNRREGHTVFVHCDAGIDRSAMVVIAYFMWRDHMARDQALDLVQRKRAIIRPNPIFMHLLNDWETSLELTARHHMKLPPLPTKLAP